MGGLSKKYYQIKNITAKNKLPYLVLDAGNVLFKNNRSGKKPTQHIITAEGLIQIYDKMGYTAVNVGPYDITADTSILKTSSSPWISSNYYSTSNKPIFPTYITKTIGDITVGIVGVTGPPKNINNDIIFKNWVDILPNIISEVTSNCDFIILLSSLPAAENREIAKLFPQVRLIISASLSHGNMPPTLENNSIITQTEKRGKYLGFLTIFNANSETWESRNQRNLANQQKKLARLDASISKLSENENSSREISTNLERLLVKKESLQSTIDSLKKKDMESQKTDTLPTTFNARFIALTSNFPEDKEINAEVKKIKSKIRNLKTSKAGEDKNSMGFNRLTNRLAGFTKCSKCHEKQYVFWQTTSHAHSYQTLGIKNESQNLNCLTCHVTLEPKLFQYAQENNSFLLSLADNLRSVGCESCHGAGATHSNNPSNFKMNKIVSSKICLNCHTAERDDNFIYDTKLGKIACPAE